MSLLDWNPFALCEFADAETARALRDSGTTLLWELAMCAGHEVDWNHRTTPDGLVEEIASCRGCDDVKPTPGHESVWTCAHVLAVAADQLRTSGDLSCSEAAEVFRRLASDWSGTIGDLVLACEAVAA